LVFVSGGHTAALASRWLSREHNQDSSYSLTIGTAGARTPLTTAGTAALRMLRPRHFSGDFGSRHFGGGRQRSARGSAFRNYLETVILLFFAIFAVKSCFFGAWKSL
jgi:hypothetical protein